MTSIQLCAHNFTTSAATLADLNIAIAVTAAAVCNETALRGRHDNQMKKGFNRKDCNTKSIRLNLKFWENYNII